MRVLHAWVKVPVRPEVSQQKTNFLQKTHLRPRQVGVWPNPLHVGVHPRELCLSTISPAAPSRRHRTHVVMYAVVAGVAMRCFKTAEAHLVACGVGGLGAGQETMLKSPT